MRFPNNIAAITIAGLIGAAAPLAVSAQAQQAVPSAAEVTSDELDAFVTAYESVMAIEQRYAPQIEQTTDPTEQDELRQLAVIEQTDAVEQTPGIGVDRYVEIIQIAQADPDLNAKILELINQ
jgi:hypothetical protein